MVSIKDAVFGAQNENVAKEETMPDGTKVSRFMETDDPFVGAEEGDLAYNYFLQLMQPDDEGRAVSGAAGSEYQVRFGTDDEGIDCTLKMTPNQMTGTVEMYGECGGDWLPVAITAEDILYIELYLSGNAENVLYRFNFYGVTPRKDWPTANSAFTPDKAIEPTESPLHNRVPRASTSQPSVAIFFLSPLSIEEGTVKVCEKKACDGSDDPLKTFDVSAYDASTAKYTVKELSTAASQTIDIPVDQTETTGEDGARYFAVALPPDFAAMHGSENAPKEFYVQLEPTKPPPPQGKFPPPIPFGYPEGGYCSAAATAAGQMVIAGVNVADGHLVRQYDDVVVPEMGITRRFTRTYNSHRCELSPLGPGWMHNYEGYLLEEVPGRYQVVVEGQAYDFSRCVVDRDPSTRHVRSIENCATDKNHGGKLTFNKAKGDPSRPAHYLDGQFEAVFDDGAGTKYIFDQLSKRYPGHGGAGRVWMLTTIDDPLANEIVLTYEDGTDWVKKAERTDGITFEFDNQPIPDSPKPHAEVQAWRKNYGLKYLKNVKGKLGDGSSIFFEEDFHFDVTAKAATDTTTGEAQNICQTQTAAVAGGVLNPLGACRKTRDADGGRTLDLSWMYTWPTSGKFDERNDMTTEALELPLEPNPDVFEASYVYENESPHKHIKDRELVVTKATILGADTTFEYKSETERVVTEPVGGSGESGGGSVRETTLTLNDFGNPLSITSSCGTLTLEFESNADDGKVVPLKGNDSTGFAQSCKYKDDLSVEKCGVDAVPSATEPTNYETAEANVNSVEGLAGFTTEIVSRDEESGIPTSVKVPGPGSGDTDITITTTVQNGFVSGQKVGMNGPSWSQPPDTNGLPDGAGTIGTLTTTFSGQDSQEFGQPTELNVNCSTCLDVSAGGANATVLSSMTIKVEYDKLGRVSRRETPATGQVVTMKHDALGRITEQVLTGGPNETRAYTYGRDGSKLTTLVATARMNIEGTVTATETVQYGLVREEENEKGEKTTYTYDSADCRLETVETTTSSEAGEPDAGPAALARRMEYVVSGVPGIDKAIELYEGDELKSTVGLDVLGQAVETWHEGEVLPDGTYATTILTRDAYGNVVKQTFGNDHHLKSTYDGNSFLTKTESDSSRHANEKKATFEMTVTSRDAAGRVTKLTRNDGATEEYAYDVLGRVVKEVKTTPSFKMASLSSIAAVDLKLEHVVAYQNNGRTEVHTYSIDSPDAASGQTIARVSRTVTIEYDDDGRVTAQKDDTAEIAYSYEEHDNGDIKKVTVAVKDLAADTTSTTVQEFREDGSVEVTGATNEELFYYSSGKLRRRIVTTSPRVENDYSYDGNWVYQHSSVLSDGTGAVEQFLTTRDLDDRGRVLFEKQQRGAQSNPPTVLTIDNLWNDDATPRTVFTTECPYANGVQQPCGTPTVKTFDANVNFVEELLPGGGEIHRVFDATGNLVFERQCSAPFTYLDGRRYVVECADGSRTFYGYSASGNLTRSLTVPETYWSEKPSICTLDVSSPVDVYEAILLSTSGNYIEALTLAVSRATPPNCDVRAIVLVGADMQFEINRGKFNTYVAMMAVDAVTAPLFGIAGSLVFGGLRYAARSVVVRTVTTYARGAVVRVAAAGGKTVSRLGARIARWDPVGVGRSVDGALDSIGADTQLGMMLGKGRGVSGGGRFTSIRPQEGWTRVQRWVSREEATLWKGRSTLPQPSTGSGLPPRTFVTLPGAPKPGGTGPTLLEFDVPTAALQKGGDPLWRVILNEARGVPLQNLIIR